MATDVPIFACLTKHPTPEQILKAVLNTVPSTSGGEKLSFAKAKAAFLKGKQWEQGQTIRIAFLQNTISYQGQILNPNYSQSKANFVRQVIMSNIAPLVNLKFEWNADPTVSDVRIMFVPELGAWSYIGTDNAHISKNQPTMNLGWIDDDTNFDAPQYKATGIVVIHEFGHMLGMIHEHSRADANLEWNKPVIYKALGGPPNNWSRQEVDQQVFETYSVDSFNGSVYDPSSVMHYIFPAGWFLRNPHLPIVTHLSPLDKEWISKTYPPDGDETRPGLNPDGSCSDGSRCYGAYCDDGTYCGKKEGFISTEDLRSYACEWKNVIIVALIVLILYCLMKRVSKKSKK